MGGLNLRFTVLDRAQEFRTEKIFKGEWSAMFEGKWGATVEKFTRGVLGGARLG